MPNQITAYAIYNAATNTYLGNSPQLISLNCTDFAAFTPKAGWLKRKLSMGVAGGTIIEYSPTFSASDPEIDSNTLPGVFVQQNDQLVMLDAASVQAVIDACDGCCDGNSLVPRYFTSGVPTPFVSPTTSNYTIARTDDGTPRAVDQFSIDYLDQVVLDPVHVSYTSGTSIYLVRCFGRPTPVGTDVVTG